MKRWVRESGAGIFSSAMRSEGLWKRLCYSAKTALPASFQLAKEAGWRPGVAGRSQLVHFQKQHIAVAIHEGLNQPLGMAAGFAFLPDFPARPRPVGHLAAGKGMFQCFPVHPGEHQHLAGGMALGDHRNQAFVIELDSRNKGGMGQNVGHTGSFRRSKPLSRSAIRSSASSRPAWMRSTEPSVLKGETLRLIWAGTIRLSNPPQDQPRPKWLKPSMKAARRALATGFNSRPNRPQAPLKSRRHRAWPGSEA